MKFKDTGLDEVMLQEIVKKKIRQLRPEINPLTREKFSMLSPTSKRLMFKHNSNVLKKLDPSLAQTLKAIAVKEKFAKQRAKAMAAMHGEDPVDTTPFVYNEPALKLGTDFEPVVYSDESLRNLAQNNSSNYIDGEGEGVPKKLRASFGFMPK